MITLSSLYKTYSSNIVYLARTSNATAKVGYGYLINATSSDITLTLPSSPNTGNLVAVCDSHDQAENHVITVARNGSKIHSTEEDLIVNIIGTSFILVYIDSTIGWRVASEISSLKYSSVDDTTLSGTPRVFIFYDSDGNPYYTKAYPVKA